MTIGDRLKKVREEKGITPAEAAQAAKIQTRIIEAIEANQLEGALDPAYARIFLKRYAVFLGLDGETILGEYLSRIGPMPSPSVSIQTEAIAEKPATPLWQIFGPAVLGLVLLLVLVGFGAAVLNRMKRPVPAPTGMADAPAAAPAARRKAKAPVQKAVLVDQRQSLKLTIRAKEDVWMQIKADEEVIFQNTLKQGAREDWTAKEGLEIWTGNASAMQMSLNGHDLGSPGRGVIKGIKVTRRGIELPE